MVITQNANQIMKIATVVAAAALVGCATSPGSKTPRGPQVPYRISESGVTPVGLAFSSGTSVSLVEGAIHNLDESAPGGPDYAAAARLLVHAARAAGDRQELELEAACYRAAARAALRAGDRAIYQDAVRSWVLLATAYDLEVGELAIHRAIAGRLSGQFLDLPSRVPAPIQRLILGETEN